jgi:hypothetical protein
VLQDERSRVLSMSRLDSFVSPDLLSLILILGSTQPLTEMITGNLPVCKVHQDRKADNLSAIIITPWP